MVYSLKAADVRDVMINGRQVVADRQSLTLDQKQVLLKAGEFRSKVSATLGR